LSALSTSSPDWPQFKNGLSQPHSTGKLSNWAPNLDEVGFYIGARLGYLGVLERRARRSPQPDRHHNNWTYVKSSHLRFGGELPFYSEFQLQAYVSAGYEGWSRVPTSIAPIRLRAAGLHARLNEFFEQYVPSNVAPRASVPAFYANIPGTSRQG